MNSFYFHALKEKNVDKLSEYILNAIKGKNKLLLLCIGTDNCTGDSLGPLTGTLLKKDNCPCVIMGDLENIIDYTNIKEKINYIKTYYNDHYIIAIDACLGQKTNVGKIFIEESSLFPAAALRAKDISIGNISIKGVVNRYASMKYANEYILQQTRLFHVYTMADVLSKSLINAINTNLHICKSNDIDIGSKLLYSI
ncbi:putative sporulation protein YyaC [Clostridium tetanomorphum]|uniref:Spore protease YyaC n=1 Tax=Clostridium tetanomorphum TaxID=1553 RepID=A0A923J377_CLOTT|nr:spore protease YyaC [Clostridium tetanomorphum]KAJ52503.1 putative sporulation protein YyaC [Clostridium tetanomorphum DSM 665]MBC2399818.1 spore protease YyaC [Clostridium tetanomorphum]MBP1864181.1 putative sporulation protein YyaC [Clostridium tetanomorphum]NRS84594.1 putative sporulation protein YyaC [Clostridium tetanomorphum]NRZ97809.1 putative sporulation protein YyaC [Clostridium tetanomorphum]